MAIKIKLKKLVFKNYFKNINIIFLFLMLSIFTFILCFYNDNTATKAYSYKYPKIIEKTLLDYDKSGYYPGNNTFIKIVWYFTYQSNLFVLIVYALFFTQARNKNWYHYLVFACLVSILMTGLIYHIVIKKGEDFYFDKLRQFLKLKPSMLISYLQHTFIPFFYCCFYFKFNFFVISYKKIWIAWIHPFLYMFIFSFLGFWRIKPYWNYFSLNQSIVSETTERIIDPFQCYPYIFFSPFREEVNNYGEKRHCFLYNGYKSVFFNFFYILIFVFLITYTLLFVKKRMNCDKL